MLRLDQIKIRVSDKQPDIRRAVCSKLKISDSDIVEEIKELDIKNLTPMEALNLLNELQSKVRNRW